MRTKQYDNDVKRLLPIIRERMQSRGGISSPELGKFARQQGVTMYLMHEIMERLGATRGGGIGRAKRYQLPSQRDADTLVALAEAYESSSNDDTLAALLNESRKTNALLQALLEVWAERPSP